MPIISTQVERVAVVLNLKRAMRKFREKQGLTQGDLFRKTGLERGYLSRLESGVIKDPRLTTVIKLARALGVTVTEFIEETLKENME